MVLLIVEHTVFNELLRGNDALSSTLLLIKHEFIQYIDYSDNFLVLRKDEWVNYSIAQLSSVRTWSPVSKAVALLSVKLMYRPITWWSLKKMRVYCQFSTINQRGMENQSDYFLKAVKQILWISSFHNSIKERKTRRLKSEDLLTVTTVPECAPA